MLADHLKDSLRAVVQVGRDALAPAQWQAQDAARTARVLAALPHDVHTVAAYAARPGEPATAALLEELSGRGLRVLVPVIARQPDWAQFTGSEDLVPGWGGIPQPRGPRLGAGALARADLVIAPCLAVATDGTRLGTGGGWYDRALGHVRAGVPVWVLTAQAEVWGHLPREPHDVPVDAVVTERAFTPLPAR